MSQSPSSSNSLYCCSNLFPSWSLPSPLTQTPPTTSHCPRSHPPPPSHSTPSSPEGFDLKCNIYHLSASTPSLSTPNFLSPPPVSSADIMPQGLQWHPYSIPNKLQTFRMTDKTLEDRTPPTRPASSFLPLSFQFPSPLQPASSAPKCSHLCNFAHAQLCREWLVTLTNSSSQMQS